MNRRPYLAAPQAILLALVNTLLLGVVSGSLVVVFRTTGSHRPMVIAEAPAHPIGEHTPTVTDVAADALRPWTS
ncbi:MAG: hypothetical protein U0Q19_15805 [Kineosporiaceae bacterium]